MHDTEEVVAAFAQRGAYWIDHPGGNLLGHLVRTSELLRAWGSPPHVVLAGLAHAAYGTDGLADALFDVGEERTTVRALIGDPAEALVYQYAACDRAFTLPQLRDPSRAMFRDRLTGEERLLDAPDARALAELTLANELDILRHSAAFRAEHGEALGTLFSSWRVAVSDAAWDDFARISAPGGAEPVERDMVVGGLRLHLLEWGSPTRPPILFLHGGGLHARTWNDVCADVRDHYRCIAVDLRGCGDSEWAPDADYSLAAHVRDLRLLLDALGLDRPVLVGHSLGGHTAMAYAVDHPDELAAMVVVDTSPFVRSGPTIDAVRRLFSGPTTFPSIDAAVEHVRSLRSNPDPVRLRRSLFQSLRLRSDGTWQWKRDGRHLEDAYFDTHIADVRALLPKVSRITCPTLLVRGEGGAVREDDAESFVSLLPDGRLVTVPDARHNVHADAPAAFARELNRFLESVPSRRGASA